MQGILIGRETCQSFVEIIEILTIGDQGSHHFQMTLTRRLLREFKKIRDAGRTDYTVQISDAGIEKWSATIFGAKGTEWADAVLRLELGFSSEYPNVAPDVRFVGTIPFHPNVYGNGKICLDLLQHNWSAAFGVEAIVTSIQTLLVAPNPNSPANNTAALLYTDAPQEYMRMVRACVEATWDQRI
jgi:ubiquitin-conjugating enzyme E2 A